MKRREVAGVALALLAGLSLASGADDGKSLYEDTCAACHGETGTGNPDLKAPAIAGQHDWYIERQLMFFRDGVRGRDMERDETGAIMRGIAESLDPADLAALAAYVAALEPVPAQGDQIAGDVALGRGLYEICAACHGVHGEGSKAFDAPKLTGLDGQYLLDQLVKFKTGVRGGDDDHPLARQMKSMAEVLSDENAMRAVVAYINTLP